MGWFDILKELTRDEYGAVRPYIRDELEEYKTIKERAKGRLRKRLGRKPTKEELREELSNPTSQYQYRNFPFLRPGPMVGEKRKLKPKPERFALFENIKLYLESQNITPTVMNILEELSDSDKTNREKDINDIAEYLRKHRS